MTTVLAVVQFGYLPCVVILSVAVLQASEEPALSEVEGTSDSTDLA